MYLADGIDLTRSEYEELSALASLDGGWKRHAESRIESDNSLAATYESLHSLGLIGGFGHFGGFVCEGVTRYGYDWLASYEKAEQDAKHLSRREWAMVAVNLGGGALLGGFTSLVVAVIAHAVGL